MMGPGETKTWTIKRSFKVVNGQVELILYDMPSSFLVDYEKERYSESLSILELCVRRPPEVRQFNTYGEEVTPNKRWEFARLDIVDLGQGIRVDLKTKDFLYPGEVEAPLNYLLLRLDDYHESVNKSVSKENDHPNLFEGQFRLQTRKPGRPVDPWNTEAYEKIKKGGGTDEAKTEAYEYWCDARGIKDPTKQDRDAFKKNMIRAAERDQRIK